MECPTNINSVWSNISFKTCDSVLILSLDDVFIDENGILNPPQLLCYCQCLLLWLIDFALNIEVLLCWVHIYLQLF